MSQVADAVRAHYDGPGLTERIKAALPSEGVTLDVVALAPLDQFHTRGLLATAELANAVVMKAADRVLDLGSGIGGPARYLAATFGCTVVGVDLSPSFVEAATYLTMRCGLSDRASFQTGDALSLPFASGAFDAVFLQHVAMNIADRVALYAEVTRVLRPGGRFATYDLVLTGGDVIYPAPWARDASTSFLLTAEDTRAKLEAAGLRPILWRDDTQAAMAWFDAAPSPPTGLNLSLVLGPNFPAIADNLGKNIREGRVGVLFAVLLKD